MLTVFIVEDEPPAKDELVYLLRRSGEAEVVGEADHVDQAIENIRRLEPDIVFLDIELADGSGLDIAKQLQELERAPAVVFATAYDEYALQAFDLDAFDYILKPFDEDRIRRTLEKLRKRLRGDAEKMPKWSPESTAGPHGRKGKLAITSDGRILMIDIDGIAYAASQEGKTVLKTADNQHVTDDTLAELERKLGSALFLRVHRSYLVNLNEISEVQPWFNGTYNLILADGSKIPVSRTYVKPLRQSLGF